MSDEKKLPDVILDRRLGRLPQEIPTSADLWPSIESAIQNDSLDRRLGELHSEIAAQNDLWPGIEARIREEARAASSHWRKRRVVSALLAACLAVFVAGIVLIQGRQDPGTSSDLPPLAGTQATDPALELLFTDLDRSATDTAGTVYREHIALVRDQRETIEAAMQQYPNDTALRTLWRHTYETELRLVDEAERVLTNI